MTTPDLPRRRPQARVALVASCAVVAVIATTGAANAYWHAAGSGAGSARGGTTTIEVTALAGGDANSVPLFPGSSGDVIVRVSDPNSYAVHVVGIVGGTITTGAQGCDASSVLFNAPSDFSAAQYSLAPGSNLLRLSSAATMSTSSPSACQGATFSIPITVTVQR